MGKSIHILFIGHDATRTGAPMILLHLLRWIQQYRGDLTFDILLKNGGQLETEYARLGSVVVLNRPYSTKIMPRIRDRVAKLFNNYPLRDPRGLLQHYADRGIDLIYSNTITNGDLLENLINLGCPILCHVHELEYVIKSLLNGNLVSDLVDRYIAVGEAVKSNLIENHRIEPDAVEIVNEFIPTNRFANLGGGCRKDFLRSHNLPTNKFVVGGCGSLEWRKGADLFLRVAFELKARSLDHYFSFVWAGACLDGNKSSVELEYDICRLGLKGTVFFVGVLADPVPFYQSIDVFLLTSREDPYPLVMLEAAASGKPIICFAQTGGGPEFVSTECGHIAPYGDVAKMAEFLEEMRLDDEGRNRIGKQAADKAIKSHDVGVCAPRIVESCLSLLARYKAGACN